MSVSETQHFDYLIMGSGMAGLTVAALLAKAGYRVATLEQHESPGGYAHTFALGNYHFSAQVHYIWGCGDGEPINEFLKKVELDKVITFEKLDAQGYDHAMLPDGQRIRFPYGLENIVNNIDAVYPGERKKIERFMQIVSKMYDEISQLPYKMHWWHYFTKGFQCPITFRYHRKTLQDVFDECGLSRQVQAVLCCQSGDLGAPPEVLSVMAYVSLFVGYNRGAYYPTKHFKFMTETIAEFINDQSGCAVFYNTEVTDIEISKKEIRSVKTKDGRTFTANNYICNIDPQKTAKIIGLNYFNKRQVESLSYEYSPSAFMIYLGLKDINLQDYGFGALNIWQLSDWDMNEMWKNQMAGNFEKPWLFLSTPYLKTPDKTSTPLGCANLEIGTLTSYQYFKKLLDQSPEFYKQEKQRIADQFIDSVAKDFILRLRDHIDVMAVGTPLTNEKFVGAPFGNCYGSIMTPDNLGLKRLKCDTPWPNFYWCNASSGYAGVYGTVITGMYVYEELTGDKLI